jgi:hypothetical protein
VNTGDLELWGAIWTHMWTRLSSRLQAFEASGLVVVGWPSQGTDADRTGCEFRAFRGGRCRSQDARHRVKAGPAHDVGSGR